MSKKNTNPRFSWRNRNQSSRNEMCEVYGAYKRLCRASGKEPEFTRDEFIHYNDTNETWMKLPVNKSLFISSNVIEQRTTELEHRCGLLQAIIESYNYLNVNLARKKNELQNH